MPLAIKCKTDILQTEPLSAPSTKASRPLGSLVRNSGYSLLTQVIPLVASLLIIPQLINRLGADRFGVLSLSWVFIGYFTLFDLGLGRATTKFVAEHLAKEKHQEIPALIWTSWILLIGLGIVGCLVFFLLIPVLVNNVLKVPLELVDEVRVAFVWVACSIPLVIYTTGIRAVLEAYQRFETIAFISTPASILSYLIPLLALLFTQRLNIIVLLLLINRAIFMGIYTWRCLKSVPGLGKPKWLDKNLLGPLVRFGGWLTVTNIIGPLMAYLDRFLVGALLSISAVAYYVTPYEMLRRLQVMPRSLMVVLFPTFSSLNVANIDEASKLFHRATRLLFITMMPLMMVFITQAEDILRVWIDRDFAVHSAPVLQWLAFGVLINTLAQVAYNWVQSAGHANVTAQFHLLELPVYLVLIWRLSQISGIVGVAIAWVIRVALDAVLLFWFAARSLAPSRRNFDYSILLFLLGIGLYLVLTMLTMATTDLRARAVLTIAVMVIYVMIVWRWFLSPEERRAVPSSLLNRIR